MAKQLLKKYDLKDGEQMKKLSEQNKFYILEALLITVQQDHPEFNEENTIGWDVLENAKIWLDELKLNM